MTSATNDKSTTVVEKTENGRYYREWQIESPKAVVLLVHGLGEHCQRYDAVASALNRAGYIVSSMDLPNHGRSDGVKGHVDSFSLFQDAVMDLYQRVKVSYPLSPLFIVGHSMGGLITTQFLIDHQDKFQAAVLSGAAIETVAQPPAWQVKIITVISKAFPSLGMVPTVDGSMVSRSADVVAAYNSDPLINHNKLSAKLLVEFANAMERVKASANIINLPLLIMHGSADKLTASAGSQWLFDNIVTNDKSLRMYEGLYHEIFNEPEGPKIYQEVVDWLNAHLIN